jgi:hypothetical protein
MGPVSERTTDVVRFRHHPGRGVAGLIVTISVLTLASVSDWLALLALPPLAWTVWVWRAGTEADRTGIRVRALAGRKWIPWSRVRGLATEGDRVAATLTDGATVPLTAVTPAELPRLAAASGQEVSRVGINPPST